jgi:hypothetical protein
MTTTLATIDLQTWGLSPQAQALLSEELELLQAVADARNKPPLPLNYIPVTIEIFFEDVLYLKAVEGVLLLARDCLPDYQPRFLEYRFDGEMALFQIGKETVVNRIAG